MVNLIDDWSILAEYVGEKIGFYQLLKRNEKIEFRVQTGRIGFVKEYPNLDYKELQDILSFCKKRRFIEISEHIRDEDFFK